MNRNVILVTLSAAILCLPLGTLYAQSSRITTAIDNNRTVVLPGHVHAKAQARYDQGAADASFEVPSITIHLKPSASQQQSLEQLLVDQQNPALPQYHKWLTPEEYADRFGASASDMGKLTDWLQKQGFTVQLTARSRTWVTFSGTAQQVRDSLHTDIHRYSVDGETHYANATDPAVPAAFAGMVSSIRGLNDFRLKPSHLRPAITLGSAHYVGPGDFATIYDVTPLYNAGIDGTGQSVAIVGQSRVMASDIAAFRTKFGLPSIKLSTTLVPGTQDPGYQVSTGDMTESDLDIEWAGAVAKNATIYFVYSPDVFRSLDYAVANAVAPVISMSYGECEYYDLVDLPSFQSTAQQANAEGITWLAASADSGAADCEDRGAVIAQDGLAVDVPGSIPEVTSVGGTEFDEQGGTYWNSTNNTTTDASALKYIPEMVWNDSAVDGEISAGGGGASQVFSKPVWQTGTGVPTDGMRDVPDVAFNASDAHDATYVYTDGSGAYYGGTSVATPSMAGIVALLNQYLVANGIQSRAGVGNLNPAIYRMAQSSPSAFHDVTTGNNAVACVIGSPDCTTGMIGYDAVPGYDRATGWGSLDAYNFVTAWSTTGVAPTSSAVVPSVSQGIQTGAYGIYGNTGVVFESALNSWTFMLTLTEEAGLATTLTGMAINGKDYSSQIAGLFGSASIPADQSISAQITLTNVAVPGNVPFTFSGKDVATGQTWSQQVSFPFQGVQTQLGFGGVSNAASGQQVYSPGEIVSIYGTGLGDFVQSAGTLPLPGFLAGFEAYVNNNPAYLYYVSPNQVNLQIPYETTVGRPATLEFGNPYAYLDYTLPSISQAGPGIFVTPDFMANPSASGVRGQIVAIYVTGVGQLTPPIADGEAPSNNNSRPVQPVSLTVGGVQVTTAYFIGVPTWSVGVLQINFTIPSTVPLGKQPIVITVGTASSPSTSAYINITQ